jgi:hypothetical protein
MSTGATPAPMPTEAQRKAFAAKLTQFRGTLDPHEATMLDALVHAARQAHAQGGEVQVYWMTTGLAGPGVGNPGDLTVGPPGSAFDGGNLGGYSF